MALSEGFRLGAYEVLALLGTGGMGEVYRARDSRLGREVALKVLPEELSADAGRLARFEREARSASALNHPHIVTVYEFGRADSLTYLSMELVEGQTLRQLLSTGFSPLKKTLSIACQVADGLARAHVAGIVHRDLKPENVMVSRDGLVKILDFGLAKLTEPEGGPVDESRTASLVVTEAGIVLGTVGYMSPEQAAGKQVDFRSDQFSFGSILYELATGERAFQKASAVQTLSAIIQDDPISIGEVNPQTPAPLSWIVERCLAKDPENRYVSTRDLARELESVRDHLSEIGRPKPVVPTRRVPRSGRLVGALLLVGLGLALGGGLALLWKGRTAAQVPAIRYLTHSGRDSSPAASPDGRTVAFSSDRDGQRRIWLKQLSSGDEVSLTAGEDDFPRFSPDGSAILFSRTESGRTSLYRMASLGGEPRKLVDDVISGDWSPDGRQVAFMSWRVSEGVTSAAIGIASAADGTGAREIARFDNITLMHPRWSPDGRSIAAIETPLQGGGIPSSVFVVGVDGKEKRPVSSPGAVGQLSSAVWGNGATELIYSRSESVAGSLTASTARVFRQNVRTTASRMILWSPINSVTLDILAPGRLVFDAGSPRENLRQVSLGAETPAAEYQWLTRGNSTDRQPAYSPDGEWVAFSSDRTGNLDLWAVSTKTGALRRLTHDAADDWDPGFMPDGRLLWSSNRTGHFEIWIAGADGSGAKQLSRDGVGAQNPTATPDGVWIVYSSGNPAHAGVWKIRPDGTQARRLVAGSIFIPEVSADGKYVAYGINRRTPLATLRVATVADGRDVPFAIRVGSQGRGRSIFTAGRSRWMPDGKTIAFTGQDQAGLFGIFAQDFVTGEDTTHTRRALVRFDRETAAESFDISPDGSRVTLAGWEQLFSILVAEGVPGVSPPGRPR